MEKLSPQDQALIDRELVDAAASEEIPRIKAALGKGANINAFSGEALQTAARSGNLEVVEYLIETGANPQADDSLALRYAAIRPNLKITRALLATEATKNLKPLGERHWFDVGEIVSEELDRRARKEAQRLREQGEEIEP